MNDWCSSAAISAKTRPMPYDPTLATLFGIAASAWLLWIALAVWMYHDWGQRRR